MSYDIVLLSGGFDPLHVGHARMIRNGATLGKKLVIGVNSDAWLMRKKGYIFMPFEERKEMVESLAGVSIATDFDDSDGSACGLLNWARSEWPNEKIAFGNGGDRNLDNIPELYTAEETNIELVWGVGGIKIQSSSTLVEDSRGSIDE